MELIGQKPLVQQVIGGVHQSPHVCERLSAMQEQVGPREYFAQLKLLIENLESLGLRPAEYPPPPPGIGTSHRELRKFGFEAGTGRIRPPRIGTSHG